MIECLRCSGVRTAAVVLLAFGSWITPSRPAHGFAWLEQPPRPAAPSTAEVHPAGSVIRVTGKLLSTTSVPLPFRMEWARGLEPSSGWSTEGLQLGSSPGGVRGNWTTDAAAESDYYTLRLMAEKDPIEVESRTVVYLHVGMLRRDVNPAYIGSVAAVSGPIPVRNSFDQPSLAFATPRALWWPTLSESDSHPARLVTGHTGKPAPAAAELNGHGGDEVVVGTANRYGCSRI